MAAGTKATLNSWKRIETDEKGWSCEDLDEFDKFNGCEVWYDLYEMDTTMGQIFYDKWRKANIESMF